MAMVTTSEDLNGLFSDSKFAKKNMVSESILLETKEILDEQIELLEADGGHAGFLTSVKNRLSSVENRLSGSFYSGSMVTLTRNIEFTTNEDGSFVGNFDPIS